MESMRSGVEMLDWLLSGARAAATTSTATRPGAFDSHFEHPFRHNIEADGACGTGRHVLRLRTAHVAPGHRDGPGHQTLRWRSGTKRK